MYMYFMYCAAGDLSGQRGWLLATLALPHGTPAAEGGGGATHPHFRHILWDQTIRMSMFGRRTWPRSPYPAFRRDQTIKMFTLGPGVWPQSPSLASSRDRTITMSTFGPTAWPPSLPRRPAHGCFLYTYGIN